MSGFVFSYFIIMSLLFDKRDCGPCTEVINTVKTCSGEKHEYLSHTTYKLKSSFISFHVKCALVYVYYVIQIFAYTYNYADLPNPPKEGMRN